MTADQIRKLIEFTIDNRDVLATIIRKKLLQVGAKEYVAKLGKQGIEREQAEAAGIILDILVAFQNRAEAMPLTSEEVLEQASGGERDLFRLPRNDRYDAIQDALRNIKSQSGRRLSES